MAQGTTFVAKEGFDFTFKWPKRKVKVHVSVGDRFWQTSTESELKAFGWIKLAREGKGCIGAGYTFTAEDIARFFTKQ